MRKERDPFLYISLLVARLIGARQVEEGERGTGRTRRPERSLDASEEFEVAQGRQGKSRADQHTGTLGASGPDHGAAIEWHEFALLQGKVFTLRLKPARVGLMINCRDSLLPPGFARVRRGRGKIPFPSPEGEGFTDARGGL